MIRLIQGTCVVLAAASMVLSRGAGEAWGTPTFARQYRTGCTTCHVAPPKLNVLGEAFRLNGYRMPDNAALLRREPPVPLGEEPWEDLWPRAIWPGEAPGTSPLAIRVVSDLVAQRAPVDGPRFTMRMPNDVYLMAGSSLGSGIGALVVAEWEQDEGVELRQAKVFFRDLIPALPSQSLNLWVGLQNLYLLTTADRQIDRIGVRSLGWQGFSWSQVGMLPSGGGEPRASPASFALGNAQPAIMLNGIVGGRTFYSVGLAQGTTDSVDDENDRKDLYYTIRHKWGGLRLDGKYDAGDGPSQRGFGQLLDNSVILEHFGYAGGEPVGPDQTSNVRAAGVALRILRRRLDVAAGAVRRWDSDPWASGVSASATSAFARGEFQMYPWLIAALKVERFSVHSRAAGGRPMPSNFDVVTPGLVALVRQNVRVIMEGAVYGSHDASSAAGRARPNRIVTRLDIAF